MQNDIEFSAPEQRQATFAKLMTYEQSQVLAYLYRDESDQLTIAIQLWVVRTDEQLRAVVSIGDEELTEIAFNSLCDDNVGDLLGEIGIPALLSDIEDAD